MMNSFLIKFFFVLIWILTSCSETTESAGVSGTQVGGVSGKVLNEEDFGQMASQVVLLQEFESTLVALDTVLADSLGFFEFPNVSAGEYSLSALTTDGLSGLVESVQVNADQVTEVNIYVTLIIIQNFNIENIETKNEFNITQIISPSNSLSQVEGQWVLNPVSQDTITILTDNDGQLDTLYIEVIPDGDSYLYQVLELESLVEEDLNSGTFKDNRDNQEYPWVRIGEQIWMAKNLNYKIANAQCYENLLSNCFDHGRLYLWVEAMDIDSLYNDTNFHETTLVEIPPQQGICPTDWHLPTRAEWIELAEFVRVEQSIPIHPDSNAYDVALYLNSQDDWTVAGYDTYGFNARSSGYQFSLGTFNFMGIQTYWWAADEKDRGGAYATSIFDNSEIFYQGSMPKFQALSVRCLKD